MEANVVKKSVLLLEKIEENLIFFEKSGKFCQILNEFENLKIYFKDCIEKVREIGSFASEYDIDENTPANGYRSFIEIFDSVIREVTSICTKINKTRNNFFFRAEYFKKEISEWVVIVQTLSRIFSALIATHQNSQTGCLFSDNDSYDNELTRALKEVDQRPFYGKNIGFHLCASMRPVVKFVVVSMACYFDFYFSEKPKIFRLVQFAVSFVQLVTMAKKRSLKTIEAYNKSTTKFVKSFWFLNEGSIISPIAYLFAPKIEINKVFNINPTGLQLYSDSLQKLVDISPPHSHLGLKSVQCRLVSAKKRKGMLNLKQSSKASRPSKHLIFHVHGGGFAAQTSKSHLSYLLKWAVDLDVPILSIDYSLTPEAPFPRALEEVFYAYCWALKNSELLGSTGENIVLVGDSAGGNLISACTIKCIEMGIRIPKGLLNIYAAVSLNRRDSPSRFFTVVDPILPFGFISRLAKEYASLRDENDNNILTEDPKKPKNQFESMEEEFGNVKVNEDYLVSPYNAPDEILARFPPTKFVTASLDPCLDDCVEFAKKLKRNTVKVELDLLKNLPHGFLYFSNVSKECNDAVILCADKIQSLL